MDPTEEKLHTDRGNVRLLAKEKATIRARILAQAPQPSPYFPFPLWARGFAASLLAVFVVGVPLTYGAQVSGPGDLLHAFEVGVIEPMEQAFQRTPEARIVYHASRLEERFSEVKEVERKHTTISSEDSQALLANVQEHADAIVEATDTAAATEENVEQLVRTAALMEVHMETLGEMRVATTSLAAVSDKVNEELEDAAEMLAEQEEDKEEVATAIVEKMNAIDDSLPGVKDQEAAKELEGQVIEIAASVAEGDLERASALTAEAEVGILKQKYLEGLPAESAEQEEVATSTPRQ